MSSTAPRIIAVGLEGALPEIERWTAGTRVVLEVADTMAEALALADLGGCDLWLVGFSDQGNDPLEIVAEAHKQGVYRGIPFVFVSRDGDDRVIAVASSAKGGDVSIARSSLDGLPALLARILDSDDPAAALEDRADAGSEPLSAIGFTDQVRSGGRSLLVQTEVHEEGAVSTARTLVYEGGRIVSAQAVDLPAGRDHGALREIVRDAHRAAVSRLGAGG